MNMIGWPWKRVKPRLIVVPEFGTGVLAKQTRGDKSFFKSVGQPRARLCPNEALIQRRSSATLAPPDAL
jgi:hypothetical protein